MYRQAQLFRSAREEELDQCTEIPSSSVVIDASDSCIGCNAVLNARPLVLVSSTRPDHRYFRKERRASCLNSAALPSSRR